MSRVLLVVCALLLAFPAAAADWARLIRVSADGYIDEDEPTTNYSTAWNLYVKASPDSGDQAALFKFDVPELPEGVVFDSAHVVVWPTGSSLSALDMDMHHSLRDFNTATATYTQYAYPYDWQTAGGYGALDIDTTPVAEYTLKAGLPPDSVFVASGATFSTFMECQIGMGYLYLILHADSEDTNGQLIFRSLDSPDDPYPALVLFGHDAEDPPEEEDTTQPGAVLDLATGAATTSTMVLTWTAPGDDGYEGTASEYDIRYATWEITSGTFTYATRAEGEPLPQVAGSPETFTVTGIKPGTLYYFAMRTSDEAFNRSGLSNVPTGTTLYVPRTSRRRVIAYE